MRALVLAVLAVALAACDRAPVDPVGTDFLVAEPDLGVVRTGADTTLSLRLEPTGPSGPLLLTIRNKEIPFDSTRGAWLYERPLGRGLNAFPYTLTDEGGGVRAGTLYAAYLPAQVLPLVSPDVGVARVGAAGAPLASSPSAVTGGLDASGQALASASLIRLGGPTVLSEEVPLREARALHTATPIDGGALLVGGATRASPSAPTDFVSPAEWLGPDGSAEPVDTGEATIRRAGHGAQLVEASDGTYLYLLGGSTPGAPRAATVDVFRVERTGLAPRLEQISPEGGAAGFAALRGLSYAPTGPLTGAGFGLDGDEGVTARSTWTTPGTGAFPFSLATTAGQPLQTPRTGAAAVDIGDGLTLVVGGRDASGDPLDTFEVYAAEADRSFRFPELFRLAVPRSEAVATIFDPARIIVGGGRPGSGSAIVAYEAFSF